MYQTTEDSQRMTDNEASERYPDKYILIRWDNTDSETGTVLCVGDNIERNCFHWLWRETNRAAALWKGLITEKAWEGL